MIPATQDMYDRSENTENYEILPTKTYKIDWVNKRIIGLIDGPEAVMQFIRKVFNTDKYAHEIYDWYYGTEVQTLVGHSYDYVVTRIPNIFKQTLLVDDRIVDVRNFQFTQTRSDTLTVSCTVDTVYGEIKYEQEVSI